MTTVAEEPKITGRWVGYATKYLEDWEVIYAEGEDDYQGGCEFIARAPDPGYWGPQDVRYVQVVWSWGSCSGCDGYEDLSDEEITKEFQTRNRDFYDYEGLKGMVALLKDAKYPAEDKIAAIEAEITRVLG